MIVSVSVIHAWFVIARIMSAFLSKLCTFVGSDYQVG